MPRFSKNRYYFHSKQSRFILLSVLQAGLFLFPCLLWAFEPIMPIPRTVEYNKNKALLGKLLFSEKLLSNDHKVSCHSCHDFKYGGADPKRV